MIKELIEGIKFAIVAGLVAGTFLSVGCSVVALFFYILKQL